MTAEITGGASSSFNLHPKADQRNDLASTPESFGSWLT